MERYILALDQGTTSSRAIIFNKSGGIVSSFQKEFTQIYPKPGWVEHNPLEIWETQVLSARKAIEAASLAPEQIVSVGITNQRETTLIWERASGKPVYNAIVWQCRRSSGLCDRLREKGLESKISKKTGLLLDPYFSGTKIKWLLEHVPNLYERAKKGELCFGTMDTWLLFNLTGGHLTEPSNASRTLLFNIHTGEWDKEILDILDIPREILPEVVPSCGDFGYTEKEIFGKEIRVGGVAGDQQAALFGQACFKTGNAKNTYGTGCFALINTGNQAVASKNRLLTTVAWDLGRGLEYALEGSIFIAGAVVQWLRDKLKILESASDSEKLAASVPDTGGVYFVPAFVGLGAPYWDPDIRGTIVGLTRGTSRAHLTRAALESIAFQSYDLIKALEMDSGQKIEMLKADGGASRNSFLMQFQADILGIPVQLADIAETTALGAAYLAGLSSGYWSSKNEIEKNWKQKSIYSPKLDGRKKDLLISGWRKAVNTARAFK